MQFNGRLKRTPLVCPNRAWTGSKVIWAQDGIGTSQKRLRDHKSGLNWQKKSKTICIPKMSRSVLTGGPTGVTSATNHSIFNTQMTLNKVINAQEGIPTPKIGPRITK